MFEEEIWKEIPGYEDYKASTYGRIWSEPKLITRPSPRNPLKTQTRHYGGGIKKQHIHTNNGNHPYYAVGLTKNRESKNYLVHRLILLTFVGECPNGMEACHNDGNSLNNNINNLRWDTPRNNQLDRTKHGTSSSTLTGKEVLEIRADNLVLNRVKRLSEKYNVSKDVIRGIIKRKTWSNI